MRNLSGFCLSIFSALTFLAPAFGQEYRPDANTVLLLHMNETAGTLVSDASGYGTSAQATGTTIAGGRFGNARSYSTTGEGITVPHSSSLNFGTGAFSIEAWINTLGFANVTNCPHHKRGSTGLGWLSEILPDGTIQIAVYNQIGSSPTICVSRNRVTDGKWHHIGGVVTQSSISLYVDGILDASKPVTSQGSADNDGALEIGRGGPGAFRGLIDEVRISNKARLPGEFNLQLPPKDLSPYPSGNSLTISWQNGGGSAPLMRYKIYRGRDSINVAVVDSTASSSFSDSGLDRSTAYYYRVSAVDSTGFESVKSYALRALTARLPGEYAADPNTVLLLHMNETSGTTVSDATTYGNHGAATSTTPVDGRFGKSRRMEGSGGISISPAPSLNFGASDFTVETWLKFSNRNFGTAALFVKFSSPGPGFWVNLASTTLAENPGITLRDASGTQGGGGAFLRLSDGNWHHLAALRKSGRVELYVDGALLTQADVSSIGSVSNNEPLIIALNFDGALIDEVRVSNKARSPEEFNLQLPPKNLSPYPSGNSLTISWQNGGGSAPLMRYKIYRGRDSINVAVVDSTASSSFSDSGLDRSTAYYYRVSAVDSTGFESVKSYALRALTARLPGEYAADPNTVLLLHLNETSGNIAFDASSYSNHGAYSTTMAAVDGKFGKGLGATAFNIPGSPSLNVGAADFTIEVWTKIPPLEANQKVLVKKTDDATIGFALHVGTEQWGGVAQFEMRDGAGQVRSASSKTRIADNRWHHVAVTRAGTQLMLYVDGIQEVGGPISGFGSCASNLSLRVGGGQSVGIIDELRVSNKARSPEEFNLQLPPKGLFVTAGVNTSYLAWQNGGGSAPLMRYRIYRGADSTNLSLIDSTSSLLYNNTGLPSGTKFFYRVSAVDSSGFESARSYASKITTALLASEYAIDTSTVLLLHLNETSGSSVGDASESNLNMTVGGTTIVDGRFGKCRSFSAPGDWIQTPHSPLLDFGTSPYTVEGWYNSLNVIDLSNILIGKKDRQGWFIEMLTAGNVQLGLTDTTLTGSQQYTYCRGSRLVNDGNWHHIAGVFTQSTLTLYIDGILDASKPLTVQKSYDNQGALVLGTGGPGTFRGLIDEIRISKKARQPSEFNLKLPPRNLAASLTGLTVNLSWQAGGGAVGQLRYRIYRGADSLSIAQLDSTISTSFSDSKTVAGSRYFYRIAAVDVSGFESVKSYATSVLVVSAPAVASSAATNVLASSATLNGTVNPNGLATNALFEWGTSSTLATYDSTSSQSIGSGASAVAVKADLASIGDNTSYYFRIRAQNSVGVQRSSIQSFTTLPKAVTLTSPANGATNQSTTVTLQWSATAGAIRYRLQVATNSAFTSMIMDDSTLTANSKQLGPLAYSTTYYWRVRVTTAVGIASYSQSFSFSTVPPPPATLTLSASVTFPARANASEYLATEYRIIGLPGSSDLAVNSLFSGTRNVDWQAYWDNGLTSNYLVEFNSSQLFRFTVGRAFWVITKGALNINRVVTSPTLNSSLEAEIPLSAGWNLITNPFNSTVAWSTIQSTNGISGPIHYFSGTFTSASNFDPYVGYYYFNGSPTLTTLRVPYASIFFKADDVVVPHPSGWRINVTLRSGDVTDESTWLGVSPAATDELDALDVRKPRALSDIPGLYLSRPEWDSDYAWFSTDVKADTGKCNRWDLDATCNVGTPAVISVQNLSSIPSHFAVHLLDLTSARSADLRSDSVYTFVPQTRVTRFRILVGERDAVAARLVEALPKDFVLSQNFPNPFNPSTTFSLDVPEASNVTVKIYNSLGQEIRILHSGLLHPGRHWFRWDGRDENSSVVPSGAYYCRFVRPDGQSIVSRMLLIK